MDLFDEKSSSSESENEDDVNRESEPDQLALQFTPVSRSSFLILL